MEDPAAINCADVFPEHGYELEADNSFSGIGGPCASFDMKLERHGLVHATSTHEAESKGRS